MSDLRQLAYSRYTRGEYCEAAQLLLRAVNEGLPVEWELSLCVEEDVTGSTWTLMKEEARKGSAVANYQLVFFHMSTASQRRNDAQALEYLTKAYEGGYTGALIQIARCHVAMGRVADATRAFMETIDRGMDVELAREELDELVKLDRMVGLAAGREKADSALREGA